MSKASEHYTYRPVDERRGFRLAILHPSREFAAPIFCSLVETSLGTHPPYEAISYVWGNPDQTAEIHVELGTLNITVNLECALRYLRNKHKPRTLWVDAISIDQRNLNERSRQVSLMKDIYTSCVVDLVWIGEAQEHAELARAVLRTMQSLKFQRISTRKSFNRKGEHRVAINKISRDAFHALFKTLAEPALWERVWVIQEIALCPQVILVLGHITIPWDILGSILDHSGIPDAYHGPYSHQDYLEDVWDIFAKTQVIQHQSDAVKNDTATSNSNILDVLSRFRRTHSTDPRDKIYGLLGLVSDSIGITPDYTKSVRDVYVEVVQSFINRTQNLDAICQSLWLLGDAKGRRDDLPSWLIDFSCTDSTEILFAQRNIFNAGAFTCKTPISVSNSGEVSLPGIDLGCIEKLKEIKETSIITYSAFRPYLYDWMPDPLMEECKAQLQPIGNEDAAKSLRYFTGEDAFRAYWRTVMTDCVAYPKRRLSTNEIANYDILLGTWKREQAYTLSGDDTKEHEINDELLRSMNEWASKASLSKITPYWRFATSDKELYCMVPLATRGGDRLAIVDGAKVPLVLRPWSDESPTKFSLVGTAYIHGFMDGEARQLATEKRLDKQSFVVY